MKRYFTVLMLGIMYVSTAFAQQKIISGTVTSAADGLALPGVSVLIKGTNQGVATDLDGKYSISVPDNNAALVFSFLGMTAVEEVVGGRSVINVAMATSTQMLDEMVVVGYGIQRKVDVTGSVSVIDGEDIAKQSSPNAISALQGKVAGVHITNSGAPGASPQIRIRGIGTVYGNANPLYVVDGVWFDDISFLNPADIQSISVLKDASSESIYGVRAANGVVLVTTKKGSGKPSINYSGYIGIKRVTNPVEMANASEYATLVNELNASQGSEPAFPDPSVFDKGTDWFDVILQNALTTNHHLSVGGSGEHTSYNFSVGYLNEEGIVKGNDYERITARLQTDVKATDFLKLGYMAVLESSNSEDIPGGVIYKAFTAAPVVPVRYADGSYGDPADYPIGNLPNNPQAQLDFFNQQSKNYRVTGNVFAELNLLKNLKFRTSFGGEFGEGEVRGYNPVYYATTTQNNEESVLNVSRSQVRNWILENTLTYDKEINEHRFTLLAGQSAQRYKSYTISGSARNVPFNSDGDLYLALGPDSTRTISDGGALATYASYFGRVNYSFQNKYLLTLSMRADGSSKFSGNQRWGYFPAVGAGWMISEEAFMDNQNLFDYLKLRGSWGKVGNASVPANLSVLIVNNKDQFTAIYGGNPSNGASITTIVPPITYWERGVGTDIGLEAEMLDSRLRLEVDWYNRKTEKAIFAIPILGSLGTAGGEIIGNQADFQNRGIEFLVGWRSDIGEKLSYDITANFSANNNKVLNVSTGANPIFGGGAAATGGQLSTRTILGQPIGQFFGLRVDGIFQNQQEVDASSQPNANPGDFKYRDINDDGVIDAQDRVVLGNPNPKYTYGLNTTFQYSNFDLTLDIQGVADIDIYNANKGVRFGAENFSKNFFEKRWHGEGTSNSYPSANIGGSTNYIPNSWFVENGSYIRIRNIQLGYSLPESFLSKSKIQRLRFYVNAQNALNFFKYNGFSPEVGGGPTSAGIDRGVYPLSATYNFGVNVTF